MPTTCKVVFGPHLSWNFGTRSLKFGDSSAGYSAIRPSFTASITCGSSKKATSNGGLLAFGAVSRAIWSVPRMIESVTAALVADLNAGVTIVLSISFQVPGKVAATNVFDCARRIVGIATLAPSVAAALIIVRRLRRMVMSFSLLFIQEAGTRGRRQVMSGVR